jgi:hypothetical protein
MAAIPAIVATQVAVVMLRVAAVEKLPERVLKF